MNTLTTARIKLTAWYLLIIMTISGSFSFVIYRLLNLEVDRFVSLQRARIERQMQNRLFITPTPESLVIFEPELILEVKSRLAFSLVGINGIILIVSGVLGYFLAGRTLKPIEIAQEQQRLFVADASHELRTPLTALKTEIEVVLREKKLTLVEARQTLVSSLEEIDKLKLLTNNLLTLSRGQHSRKLQYTTFSIDDLFADVEKDFEAVLKIKNQILVKQSTAQKITSDYSILKDLLSILVDNASKYSDINKKITLVSKQRHGKVQILVVDEGIGIAADDIPHIFDRFYRSDSSRNKNSASGFGLGLSIAQNLSSLLQGSISVKSQINKGSSFMITFPSKNLREVKHN